MKPPDRVSEAVEFIDQPQDDYALEVSLDHVAAVNRWLGGTRALLGALRPMLPPRGDVLILDVGTGSADLPLEVARLVRRHGLRIKMVAVDRHPQTVRIAEARTREHSELHVCRADVLQLPFADDTFDFAVFALTLHHLPDAAQAPALRELGRVTRRAVLVSELERAWPHYLGARLLAATLWRGNALTRHDAPLSVLRAFTPTELRERARAAGWTRVRVLRRFFYRLVLVLES